MTVAYQDEHLTLHEGDCIEVMQTLPDASVDAVCTDPPYGLEFMGQKWDRFGRVNSGRSREVNELTAISRGPDEYVAGKPYQEWCEAWAREALRVAQPGAHLLAFGGTRTVHRLACAIEDAGWEIRDCLVWGYAQGFPKSHDVSKAIDKAAGAEREVVGSKLGQPGYSLAPNGAETPTYGTFGDAVRESQITAPATDEAKRWSGWGTALKPAWEPIVMARKPFPGNVASNVLRYGTGALNIDGTRIPMTATDAAEINAKHAGMDVEGYERTPGTALRMSTEGIGLKQASAHELGRWPANVVLTDPIFDGGVDGVVGGGETGLAGVAHRQNGGGNTFGGGNPKPSLPDMTYGDSGTYSRFFLIPKEARSGREPLIAGQLQAREVLIGAEGHKINPMTGKPVVDLPRENQHPTVKPIELMRHLVRLVTPPGGTVLDCFLGSGSTAIAAGHEGMRCIGIEQDHGYIEIAIARLAGQPLGLGL